MGTPVDQAVCPKCGRKGLYINTEDWKPVTIKCPDFKRCGWQADIRQFWPEKTSLKDAKTHGR